MIFKHEELAGDGGHYDEFGSNHDVNYHLRTIAHNTILVHDPDERWPAIRAGNVAANDGGQHHDWRRHNGAVEGAAAWERGKARYDIADLLLPAPAEIRLVTGEELYQVGDTIYPPIRNPGPAPECRIEVSPREASDADFFLHVLTAADRETASVPRGEVVIEEPRAVLTLNGARIEFQTQILGAAVRTSSASWNTRE